MNLSTLLRFVTLGCLLACAMPADASSSHYVGTVVSSEPAKDGGTRLKVLVHLDNYKKDREREVRTFDLPADVPIYLDWEPATPEKAFAPGRSMTFFTNHTRMSRNGKPLGGKFKGSRNGGAIFVSTASGSSMPADPNAKDCSLVVIEMSGAGDFASLVPDQKKVMSRLDLLLEVNKGTITRAAALTPSLQGCRWHEADANELTLADGVPKGRVKVRFRGVDGNSIQGSYTFTEGKKGPEFNGTLGGKAVSGRARVHGQKSARPGKDANLVLWIRDSRYGNQRYSYMVCEFKDGAADDGLLCYRKANAVGTFSDAALKLTEKTIVGTFSAKGQYGQIPTTVRAAVLDGRYVLAELTTEEGKEPIRAYGFLISPAAEPLFLPRGK